MLCGIISSVQLLHHVQLFVPPQTVACQASPSFTISWRLLKFMSTEWVMPSNHLILCCPLLLLPSVFPSIRVFFNKSALHIRCRKYWSFNFTISPSNEYSGLIFFRIEWFDFLTVQGTLKSLLYHHSSKASVLWHSVFFMVQLSPPYMTTGKTIALTILWTLLAKWCLCFLIYSLGLSWLFFHGARVFKISQLQLLSAVILEPKKI